MQEIQETLQWAIDGLQVGHLQSASLLFAFPEARDRWAPVEEFTTSPLFGLRNGSNSRNRVNSQALSLLNISSQILKEINPEYLLEGLMLKLKL